MIDVQLHLRGEQSELRCLAAVPAVGSYIDGGAGRLWQVEAVVFCEKAVAVYAVQVSARLAGDLLARWAGDPQEVPSYTCDGCGETVNLRPCVVCQALRAKKGKSKKGS